MRKDKIYVHTVEILNGLWRCSAETREYGFICNSDFSALRAKKSFMNLLIKNGIDNPLHFFAPQPYAP